MEKNQIYEVEIKDMNNLGNGICRVGDMAVFVPRAVTGDKQKIKIIKVNKSYAVARTESILASSPYRETQHCPVSGRCGGCVYGGITYEYEKQIKREYVKSVMKKADLSYVNVLPVVSDGRTEGYRNKVQYPVGEGYKVGYYALHSHDIVPCGGCLLQPEIFTEIISDIISFLKDRKVGVYSETEKRGLLRHIYLRIAPGTGQIMVCLVLSRKGFPFGKEFSDLLTEKYPEIRSVVLNYNTDDTNVILGGECYDLYGDGFIEDVLCGMRYRISALSFYQVNSGMAELLYKKALELADIQKGDKAADLYCGVGTIGLYMAKNSELGELVGIEIVPQAIENARINAKLNGVVNARFVCGDADDPAAENADIIILDPPRKGCSPELLKRISGISPEKIVYISCNCATFARDAKILEGYGYKIGDVTPYDLFPRTGHVECVTLMTRK